MEIQSDILSDTLKASLISEIAKHVGVEETEVMLKSVSFDFSNETLNLKDVTRKTIIRAIARSGGKISHAAKQLGITRKTLYAMIKKYELGSILHIHE
jgi:transcriptional regulator of acetoin/glycerol metabolism